MTNQINEIGTMIIHPGTYQMTEERNYDMFSDWQSVNFIYATNCIEEMTDTHVTITGFVNEKEFSVSQPIDTYFDGCFFEYKQNEVEYSVTNEEVIEEIEQNNNIKVNKNKSIKNLYQVEIDNKPVLSYRLKNNKITVFPYMDHFSNNAIFDTSVDNFLVIIEQLQKRGLHHDNSIKIN